MFVLLKIPSGPSFFSCSPSSYLISPPQNFIPSFLLLLPSLGPVPCPLSSPDQPVTRYMYYFNRTNSQHLPRQVGRDLPGLNGAVVVALPSCPPMLSLDEYET